MTMLALLISISVISCCCWWWCCSCCRCLYAAGSTGGVLLISDNMFFPCYHCHLHSPALTGSIILEDTDLGTIILDEDQRGYVWKLKPDGSKHRLLGHAIGIGVVCLHPLQAYRMCLFPNHCIWNLLVSLCNGRTHCGLGCWHWEASNQDFMFHPQELCGF